MSLTTPLGPVRLATNRVPDVYRGGARIDSFRGAQEDGQGPEDWIGSVTLASAGLRKAHEAPEMGLAKLADGSWLRDHLRAQPLDWLGARDRDDPALLVKLLDAGERLPVHYHPTDAFARDRLAASHGKTEAWVVVEAVPDAEVWLGFRTPVEGTAVRAWVDRQDVGAMLDALNRLPARPGDAFFVPAGVPHVIGAGLMLIELQQPSSLSIMLEHERFGVSAARAHLGAGWAAALEALDTSGYSGSRLERLTCTPRRRASDGEGTVEDLLPPDSRHLFRARRVRADGLVRVGTVGFAIFVVLDGVGRLLGCSGAVGVRAGETWAVPAAFGELRVDGRLEAVLCLTGAAA